MKKGKHIHRNITAKRSEHSICLDVTSTLEVGNKFRYKGYACTVDDITRKLVRFTGTRNEKVGEVTRQMIVILVKLAPYFAIKRAQSPPKPKRRSISNKTKNKSAKNAGRRKK